MEVFLYLVVILVGAWVVVQGVRIYHARQIGERLVARSQALSADVNEPKRHIAILGDSLWAGVGALDPSQSLAGRLIESYPNSEVINEAVSGARINAGAEQLTRALRRRDLNKNFDLIFIQLGANDILYFSNIGDTMQELRALLRQAKTVSEHVIFAVSGSLGYTPVFLWPLDWLYTWRTKAFLERAYAVADNLDVTYVDFFRSRANDPFVHDPDTYYAADGFHLSGAGYGVWYETACAEVYFFGDE